ncbi:MAG: phospholipase D-like domain-containing protein [Bacteroidetes bacterium]|nr:phospholipase D-like domain-containing protein [Bacteroidota bacterium]
MKFENKFNPTNFLKGMIFLFASFMTTSVFGQAANHIVISEVAPMGGSSSAFNSGEYIELYNPFSTDVTFGANVKITSGGGTTTSNAAYWTISLAGKTIKGYGFLLIGDGGVAVTPDLLFPSSHNLANSGTRSSVQLMDGVTIIDAFGWDPLSISSPNCEVTAFQPSSTSSDKKSFERKSGVSATSHDTQGNAWDSNDNSKDFFENTPSTANPQNSYSPIAANPYNLSPTKGPGTVTVSPGVWKFNASTTIKFVLKTSSGNVVNGLKIVKPTTFVWDSSLFNVQPNTVNITQSADTTVFNNFTLTGTDSITITIPNVTAADTTDEFTFSILTSSDGASFSSITVQPKTLVYGLPKTAAEIKVKKSGVYSYLGKWVVMQGIVTAGNEFGGPSYLQDNTAGFAIYDSSVSNHIECGDEITVLGKVTSYNELFELTPASILETIGQGIAYDTLTLTIPQVKAQIQSGVEPYESRLIRINGIEKVLTTNNAPTSSWKVTGNGTNYNLVVGSDTIQARISAKTNLANLSIPSSKFDIVGDLGQYTNLYQLLPRSYDDIIVQGAGPRIVSFAPYESSISPSGMTFSFQTNSPGTTIINYGKTSAYGSTASDGNYVTQHQITLSGLDLSTVYHVRLGSSYSNDTTYTSDYIVETSSLTSTGTMNVYFNRSIDNSVSTGEDAQVVNISQKLLNRIDAAQHSIDLALYSLSGTVGSSIAAKLIDAKKRGVKVRVIGENDNSGTAPWTTLKSNAIQVIFDNYDATNAGAGLMHNKFVVVDNRDSSDTDDWVWTGSWNATDLGNNNDAQNVIEIQDKSLANAYTIEFEEMWGSNTNTPNASNSRFGARKMDNTPHIFNIAGTPVELYFDPSDNTTNHIGYALNASVSSINVGLLTFTRSDLAQILVNKKNAGEKVHVILDNKTDTGNQFSFLQNNGVDIRLKGNAVPGLFHHKYAVIDADKYSADQVVITGSHNWSSSAENSNNENTLVIHNHRIANLYLQEFKARYIEAGGTDVISDVAKNLNTEIPTNFDLKQNYPNPFNPTTTIIFSIPAVSRDLISTYIVTLKVYDVLGREVVTLVNEEKAPGNYEMKFDGTNLASGVYFYSLMTNGFFQTKKMILMK